MSTLALTLTLTTTENHAGAIASGSEHGKKNQQSRHCAAFSRGGHPKRPFVIRLWLGGDCAQYPQPNSPIAISFSIS